MTEAPAWLVSLVDHVVNCMEASAPAGSVGYRWRNDDDEFWEVSVYSTPVELVGGAVDGEIVYSLFSLDLQGLSSCFEKVADFRWQAHVFGPHDPEGPSVCIEGVYQGHHVSLRVLSEPPEDEEPGLDLEIPPNSE